MDYLRFVGSTVNIEQAYLGNYNLILVLVSYAVAVLAAYAALSLSSVVSATPRIRLRYAWIAAGSAAMGIGIWAMHFIGMLAYMLPMPVVYEPGLTLLSVLPAVLASAVVLHIISRPSIHKKQLITGGVLMGGGIGAMHYMGMAATRMDAVILYDPTLFLVSLLVAVLLAMLALYVKFLPQRSERISAIATNFGGPLIMGLAVTGMHYTAMSAAHYLPNGGDETITGFDPVIMASLIGVASFLVLSLILLATFASKQLEAKKLLNSEVARGKETEALLSKTAEELEDRVVLQANRLAAVIDGVLDGIVTVNEVGTIESFNPAARQIFGYTDEEAIGRNVKMLMPEPYKSEHDGYMANYLQTGEARIIGIGREVTGQRKDGSTFPMSLGISEFRASDTPMFVGVVRDITERKQIESDLVNAKEKAEEATRAKSEFLANMSHEIRTPMGGVLGMLELIEHMPLEEKQKQYLETARESANALLTVINDILDFSKIEAGHLMLEHTTFDLQKMTEDAATLVAVQAANKGLEVNCLVPIDLPGRIKGDPVRLRQILLNLASNAIKFTNEGEVDIFVSRKEETEKHITLRFDVKDTGIGIPIGIQDNLFNAFTQEDSSTTRKFGGTGLGLTISKQLVDLMGGEIGVNSTRGQGSLFWFTVEFEKADEQSPQYTKSVPDRLRILAVDDNDTNRQILSHYLSNWEIQHELAVDGESALIQLREAVARDEPFHTVILDYHMPGMDGIELAREIKADAALSETRLILLSSVGESDLLVNQLDLDRYLTKPVPQSDLYDAILQKNEKALSDIHPSRIEESNRTAVSSETARVLIVDDVTTNQLFAKEAINHLGLEADIADNGQQAIDALAKYDYDLVFMDCQMPVLDGYAATEIIRAQERAKRTSRLPIIALTAHAMEGDKEACLAAGMDDYLSKPFSLDDIRKKISQWLPDISGSGATEEIAENEAVTTIAAASADLSEVEVMAGPLFDNDILDELRQLNFKLIAESFETESSAILSQLDAAVTQRDLVETRKSVHKLKGMSGNIGSIRLVNLCEQLELLAGNEHEQVNDLTRLFEAIKMTYEQTLNALRVQP